MAIRTYIPDSNDTLQTSRPKTRVDVKREEVRKATIGKSRPSKYTLDPDPVPREEVSADYLNEQSRAFSKRQNNSQLELEAAQRRQREADKADSMFNSFNRATDQMAQGVDTAKSFDITTAVEDLALRKYDQNTPYRLLLKALPYAIPMGAAATSLAIDGARAFRYGQQALLANNGLKRWIIGLAFKHPNSKFWLNLVDAASNAITKPRFNSLLNIGKKPLLIADGIGVGFDGLLTGLALNRDDYVDAGINAGQGVAGILGMLGSLGKFSNNYNNVMNVVRPSSNGFEVGNDFLNLRRLIKYGE